jgi:hypothetical protein
MRWALLLTPVLLGGCVTDNGAAFLTSVAGIPAALTAQDTLEVDLIKDLVRKSDELEFVSNHNYSCGDPNDRYLIDADYDYRSLTVRYSKKKIGFDALAATRKKQEESNALLKSIALYGATIKTIATNYKLSQDIISGIKGEVDALQKGGGLTAAGPVLTGLSALLSVINQVDLLGETAAIQKAAIGMQEGLQIAAKKLKDQQFLAALTNNEAIAFTYWDACANERLAFIRDYFYPVYNPSWKDTHSSSGHLRFQGMTQTSVLDFAKEYRQYLLDREAFIARRPNYAGLMDAIVKANADIVKAPDDAAIVAGMTSLTSLTSTIQPAAVTLAKTKI